MLIRNLFGYSIVGLSPRKIWRLPWWFMLIQTTAFAWCITFRVFRVLRGKRMARVETNLGVRRNLRNNFPCFQCAPWQKVGGSWRHEPRPVTTIKKAPICIGAD
ncbi:hypothetical protein D3C87_655330 [compost metagenome]